MIVGVSAERNETNSQWRLHHRPDALPASITRAGYRYDAAVKGSPASEEPQPLLGARRWPLTGRDPRPDVRFTVAEQQARYGFSPPRS